MRAATIAIWSWAALLRENSIVGSDELRRSMAAGVSPNKSIRSLCTCKMVLMILTESFTDFGPVGLALLEG